LVMTFLPGLRSPSRMDQVEALIILVVKFVVMINCHNLCLLAR
jgi:hypothetical protein